MAKTKKVDLSAFNNVLDGLGYGNVMHQEEVSDTTNDIIDNDDIDNLDNNDDITSDVNAEDNESTNENFETIQHLIPTKMITANRMLLQK